MRFILNVLEWFEQKHQKVSGSWVLTPYVFDTTRAMTYH